MSDPQAARGENPQAARGENPQAARGENPQAARGENPQAARGENPQAARGQNPQAARGENPQAARGENPQAARGENPQAARGENPQAAETLGVKVMRYKYVAVIVSGAMAGIGGGYLALVAAGGYVSGQTGGRGFIGLAAMIFGNWRPGGLLVAALLFGYTQSINLRGGTDSLQDLMGHARPETTAVYLRRLNRRRRMDSVRGLSWATPGFQQIAGKLLESKPVAEKEGFEPSFDANPHGERAGTQDANSAPGIEAA